MAVAFPSLGRRRRARPLAQRLLVYALILAIALPLLPWQPAVVSAATLPAGFQETTVLSGLNFPTAVRFATDGRIFVAEKRGVIKVFDSMTDTTPTTFADMRTKVYNIGDLGLLGMALHPNFPADPSIYIAYTHDAAIGQTAPRWGQANDDWDECPNGEQTNGCIVSGRVSRLTAAGNQMTGAELVLVEGWCQQGNAHSMGGLVFGPDGALYVGGGDGAMYHTADYGQLGSPANPCGDPPTGVQSPPTARGGSLRSQSLRRPNGEAVVLNGTILRFDPATGAALPDNPLAGSPDVNARRVIAYGLRNPYRVAFRPDAGVSELWVGDPGWTGNSFEEINLVANAVDPVVENFGWPCYEGPQRQSGWDGLNLDLCESLYGQSGAAMPYYAYGRYQTVTPSEACPTGGGSISGLVFLPTSGTTYPVTYRGALFFTDYGRNCIWAMRAGANGRPDPSQIQLFASGAPSPVDLQIGPGGDLFYVAIQDGTIRRIRYFSANQPPTAVITADKTGGPLPLTVAFDGTASSDPDPGDSLAYAWDLDGDGAFDDSTAPKPTRTYTQAGNVTVRLRVTDTKGASGTTQLLIAPGNTPPTAVISAPAGGTTWKVGDAIAFAGGGTDVEDGPLPPSALTWTITLAHCPGTCHTHPLQGFSGVASGSFPATDHEYPSSIDLRLTVTDAGGLTGTRTIRLAPQTVTLNFQSSPAGLELAVGPSAARTPFNRTAIRGSSNSVSAPSPQTLDGRHYQFGSWSDGGAQSHTVIAGADAVYTAAFTGPGGPGPTPTAGATTWYFAEGYTGAGFDQYLTILNPNATAAAIGLTYFIAGGGAPIEKQISVPASSRYTVAVHDPREGVGRGKEVSTKVTSTNGVGIVVERPMYFTYGANVTGGHTVMGATAPRSHWYFAEGYTGAGFDQYLTILNPNPSLAPVTLTYFLTDGGPPIEKTLIAPANSRSTVAVHEADKGIGRGKEASVKVTTTNVGGVVVERPMYFTYGAGVTGGHVAMGAEGPRASWLFAEGYTGPGFDEYFTILNPSGGAAPVTITYYLSDGSTQTKQLTVGGNRRATVVVHDAALGVGRGKEVSAKVETPAPGGIVVERPMYFTYGAGITDGHVAVGAAAPATVWHLAEGYTAPGFDEYLSILNPGDSPVTAKITYYRKGAGPVVTTRSVAARARATVAVHDEAEGVGRNGGAGWETAATVDGSGPIVVERPMYFTYPGGVSGGHNVLGLASTPVARSSD